MIYVNSCPMPLTDVMSQRIDSYMNDKKNVLYPFVGDVETN